MHMPVHKLTLNEYLVWEDQQPDRNEFYRGEVLTGQLQAQSCLDAKIQSYCH